MNKIFTLSRTLMKICTTQGLIAILITGMSMAHTNHAQVLDRVVSLSLTDASLDETIHVIANHAQVKFAYSPEQLSVQDRITFRADQKTVREILDEILVTRNIFYAVQDDGITISLKRVASRSSSQLLPEPEHKRSSVTQVTGLVSDASGQPMAGVNVVIKGSTLGTTTDASGKYSLQADPDDVLVFSFIGFATHESRVGDQTIIDVTLQEDATKLNAVTINVGYWEVREREQTGNVSRVTAAEIKNQPINNPLQALQGRMAGVYIQQTTGVPGGGFKIQIRGQNSLRADGNDPLYVVDGVPFTSTSLNSGAISNLILREGSPLASINPADIESIEILKDADATAIYGSRGANGVVLITTKKGTAGNTKMELNVAQGVARVSNHLDMLNTQQYIAMRKEALANDGFWPTPPALHSAVPDVFIWDTTRYTNWQKELIGNTAHTSNAQLSFSGGNEQTKFTLGGGYYKETTVFPGDFGFRRVSANVSFSHLSPNRKLQISSSVNYTNGFNRQVPFDFTNIAITMPPNAPALYQEDGGINWDWENENLQNPIGTSKRKYENTTNNLITNATISYEITPGLRVKNSMGYTAMQVRELATSPIAAIPPQFYVNQTGASSFGSANMNTWILEPQAAYEKTIWSGQLSTIVGATFQESTQTRETITGYGYTSDAMLENIRAATSWQITSADYSRYRYAALFGRINYTWKDRYLLNLTGRRDGSSRFGTGNRFGNFGAIGVGWIFSNESFLRSSNLLSFGKLRSSFGTTGSDAIGNYQYLSTFAPTTHPYDNRSSLYLNRLSNEDYSWESNRKFEVAVELGLWEDAVSLSTSFYLNRSSNQLVGLPLPLMTGQSSVRFNLPAVVENRGWEFVLRSSNVKRGTFSWSTSANLTLPENTLIAFPDLHAFPAYVNTLAVGKSIFTRKTLTSTGVDPTTGIYTFKDVNEDNRISTVDDGEFKKEVAQQFFGGVNNTLTWGGFQVDVFLQFVKQTGLSFESSFGTPGGFSNQPQQIFSRWQQPGDLATVQQFTLIGPGVNAYGNYLNADQIITDASFLRLKNVSFSWNVPQTWVSRLHLSSCRVYAIGQNLFTWTNYVGMDPENQNVNYLPPLRMISFGASLTF